MCASMARTSLSSSHGLQCQIASAMIPRPSLYGRAADNRADG